MMIADDSYSGSIVPILEHILRCIETQYSRLLSIRRCIEIQYSRSRSILICITILCRSRCLSVFFCVLCFCGCTRASCVLFGHSNTRVSPDAFISRFTVESVQCGNESIGRHPVSRVVQRTLESTQLSLLVSTPLSVLSTRLESWNSRVV